MGPDHHGESGLLFQILQILRMYVSRDSVSPVNGTRQTVWFLSLCVRYEKVAASLRLVRHDVIQSCHLSSHPICLSYRVCTQATLLAKGFSSLTLNIEWRSWRTRFRCYSNERWPEFDNRRWWQSEALAAIEVRFWELDGAKRHQPWWLLARFLRWPLSWRSNKPLRNQPAAAIRSDVSQQIIFK